MPGGTGIVLAKDKETGGVVRLVFDVGSQNIQPVSRRGTLTSNRRGAGLLGSQSRALKVHAGIAKVAVGKPLDQVVSVPDVDAVERGAANLRHHLRVVQGFGVKVVVALNRFPSDSPEAISLPARVPMAASQ